MSPTIKIFEVDGLQVVRIGSLRLGAYPDKESACRAAIAFGTSIQQNANRMLIGLHEQQLTAKLHAAAAGRITYD